MARGRERIAAAGLLLLAVGGCGFWAGERRPPVPKREATAVSDSLAAAAADSVAAALVDSLAAVRADSIAARQAAVPPVLFAPRALWIVRHDLADPMNLVDTIHWADSSGFTDLFLQVRGRADAYYRSAIVPRADELASERLASEQLARGGDLDRDPLAEAIALARARGLRVHAWINVFLAWSAPVPPRSPDHLVNRHPDWFVWIVPRRGRIPRSTLEFDRSELDARELEGHFLAPWHPEVGAHLEAVVRELVSSYPLDGLHLDYPRLPKMVKSFDPLSRTAFRAVSGVDPLELHYRRDRRGGEAEQLAALWQRWNEDQVTDVVARLARAAREIRPGITISAAVYPRPAQARSERGQAWDEWLDSGLIDIAVPMCYAPQTSVVRADLEVARAVTRGRLWAGLALYNKPLAQALAGARIAADLGYEGLALFSHGAAREAGDRAGPAIAATLAAFASGVP